MHVFYIHLLSPGICSTVCAMEEDISQCASSAVHGFEAWSNLTCSQRAKVLLRFNNFTHSRSYINDLLSWRLSCGVCPPLTGWWALLAYMGSVCQSCVSCVEPHARPLLLSDCCSTTAAGLSSETRSSLAGHRWVRLVQEYLHWCFIGVNRG